MFWLCHVPTLFFLFFLRVFRQAKAEAAAEAKKKKEAEDAAKAKAKAAAEEVR